MAGASRTRIGLGNAMTIFRTSGLGRLRIEAPPVVLFSTPAKIGSPGIEAITAALRFIEVDTFWGDAYNRRRIETLVWNEATETWVDRQPRVRFLASDARRTSQGHKQRRVEEEAPVLQMELTAATLSWYEGEHTHIEPTPYFPATTFEAFDATHKETHRHVFLQGYNHTTRQYPSRPLLTISTKLTAITASTNPRMVFIRPATLTFDAERLKRSNRNLYDPEKVWGPGQNVVIPLEHDGRFSGEHGHFGDPARMPDFGIRYLPLEFGRGYVDSDTGSLVDDNGGYTGRVQPAYEKTQFRIAELDLSAFGEGPGERGITTENYHRQLDPVQLSLSPYKEIELRPHVRRIGTATLRFSLDRTKPTLTGAVIEDGLVAWYDATRLQLEDGAAPDKWRDRTNSRLHVHQPVERRRARFRTNGINGRPAFEFDGVDDYFELEQLYDQRLGTKEFTTFIVLKPQSLTQRGVAYANASPDIKRGHYVGLESGRWRTMAGFYRKEWYQKEPDQYWKPIYGSRARADATIITLKYSSTAVVRRIVDYKDGEPIYESYTTYPYTFYQRITKVESRASMGNRLAGAYYYENRKYPIYIGSGREVYGPANFFHGLIGEILIYRRDLDSSEIALVEEHLRAKWDIGKDYRGSDEAALNFEASDPRPFSTARAEGVELSVTLESSEGADAFSTVHTTPAELELAAGIEIFDYYEPEQKVAGKTGTTQLHDWKEFIWQVEDSDRLRPERLNVTENSLYTDAEGEVYVQRQPGGPWQLVQEVRSWSGTQSAFWVPADPSELLFGVRLRYRDPHPNYNTEVTAELRYVHYHLVQHQGVRWRVPTQLEAAPSLTLSAEAARPESRIQASMVETAVLTGIEALELPQPISVVHPASTALTLDAEQDNSHRFYFGGNRQVSRNWTWTGSETQTKEIPLSPALRLFGTLNVSVNIARVAGVTIRLRRLDGTLRTLITDDTFGAGTPRSYSIPTDKPFDRILISYRLASGWERYTATLTMSVNGQEYLPRPNGYYWHTPTPVQAPPALTLLAADPDLYGTIRAEEEAGLTLEAADVLSLRIRARAEEAELSTSLTAADAYHFSAAQARLESLELSVSLEASKDAVSRSRVHVLGAEMAAMLTAVEIPQQKGDYPTPEFHLDATTIEASHNQAVSSVIASGVELTAGPGGAPLYTTNGVGGLGGLNFPDGLTRSLESTSLGGLLYLAAEGNTYFVVARPQVDSHMGIFTVSQSSSMLQEPHLYLLRRYGRSDWYDRRVNLEIQNQAGIVTSFRGNPWYAGEDALLSVVLHPDGMGAVYINGLLDQTFSGTAAEDVALSFLRIGVSGSGDYDGWKGVISEILVYKRALSDEERHLVEEYLRRKYNLPPSWNEPFPTPDFWLDPALIEERVIGLNPTRWDTRLGGGDFRPWSLQYQPSVNKNLEHKRLFFDGDSSMKLTSSPIEGSLDITPEGGTLFAVAQPEDTSHRYIFSTGHAGSPVFAFSRFLQRSRFQFYSEEAYYYADGSTTWAVGQPALLSGVVRPDGTGEIYVNGVLEGSYAGAPMLAAPRVSTSAVVGDNYLSGNNWRGYISEVLYYKRALSEEERQAVETYLKAKYSL